MQVGGEIHYRPFDRYTYGIDFDQELDAFKDEFPERMEGLSDRTIFRDSKFGMYVRDRFGPLVKKGSLMVCGQRALAPDQYRCLNDETYVKLFQSTNDEAIFVSGKAYSTCPLPSLVHVWRRVCLMMRSLKVSLGIAILVAGI